MILDSTAASGSSVPPGAAGVERGATAARWLRLVVIALLLTPFLWIVPGVPAIRLEEMILGLMLLGSLSWLATGRTLYVVWGVRQTLMLGLFVLIPLSTLAGELLGVEASIGDLNQYIRYGKYLVVYTLAITAFRLGPQSEDRQLAFLDFVGVASLILALIAIQQFFDLFSLNSLYVESVAPPTHTLRLIQHGAFRRPVGMAGNPNVLGFIFAVCALATLYSLLRGGLSLKRAVVFAGQLTGLLLTTSRGSLVSFVGGAGTLLALHVFRGQGISFGRRAAVVGTAAAALTAALVAVLMNEELFEIIGWRFAILADLETSTTWQERLRRWQENRALFARSPIVGVGPMTRAGLIAPDNEWLMLLRAYGVVGLAYLILVMIWPLVVAVQQAPARHLAMAIFVTMGLYMIPLAVVSSLILMPLVLILIALSDTTGRVVRLVLYDRTVPPPETTTPRAVGHG